MTNTTLFLSATCAYEYFDEAPSIAVIEVDDALRAEITRIAEVMKANKLHEVRQPFYGSKWFTDYPEDDIETIDDINAYTASNETFRVDGSTFSLVDYGQDIHISFKTYPKHCGDSEALFTTTLDIAELLGDNTTIISLN